jgi:hypothetical protein
MPADQQATLGGQGRKQDPLYRIRKLLLTAAEQLTQRGQMRLRPGGDPGSEVTAAWQGKELLLLRRRVRSGRGGARRCVMQATWTYPSY